MNNQIEIILLKEAVEFIKSLPPLAYKKILYNIDKVKAGVIDKVLFKKLTDSGIWEFRTIYNSMQYRLLAFWDTEKNTLIIVTHGFVKKTWEVPKKEIAKAELIKNEYFKSR